MNALRILTNDPSITAWGYAVVDERGKVLNANCIKTEAQAKKRRIRKGDDIVRRVGEINHSLLYLIKKYRVNYLLSELPHGSQNASAAVMIGIVTGIVQTLSDSLDIAVEWYSEQDAKKCLLNKNSATKAEIIEAISYLYEVRWDKAKYKNEAIADALAIHNVASQQSPVLKFWK